MNVVRVTSNFYPYITGPANQVYQISLGLENRGIDSPVYTSNFKAEKSSAFEVINGVKVRRFRIYGRFLQYTFTPGLIRGLTKTKTDILHVHGYRTFQSDVSYLFSKMKHIPLVINSHGCALQYDMIIEKTSRKIPYLLYDKITLKRPIKDADYVIASSKQEYEELEKFGIEKGKIRIIPVGTDLKEYANVKVKRSKNCEGISKILFVGRLTKDRNVELLLEAFSLISDRKNLKVTIVGGEERRTFTDKLGYLNFLKRKSQSLGISDRVEFTGPLFGEDLKKAYKSAEIFVYTSLYENFGQTILEAASAGLPIISTHVGVANDLIIEGESGFLTSFNNPVELSEKIMKIISNEKMKRKFSYKIRKLVAEKYQWDVIVQKYLELYDKLL